MKGSIASFRLYGLCSHGAGFALACRCRGHRQTATDQETQFFMDTIEIRVDPHPTHRELSDLWRATWEIDGIDDFRSILTRSLTHAGAYLNGEIVGFANLAWDGGIHGFLTDVCVHPNYR